MIKVAILPERYGPVFSPCASIRLASFFDSLRAGGGEIEVRYLILPELEAYKPDLVVWHRVALPTLQDIDELGQILRRIDARAIYDLDDNLLDLDGHGEAAAYESKKRAVRESLKMADEVWCSTTRLAERVATETGARVVHLPNALAPEYWPTRSALGASNGHQPLRMIYMGTRTHDDDFHLLERALVRADEVAPGSFTLTTVGVRANCRSSRQSWLKELDPPAHVGASYPAFTHWFAQQGGFDLGVAPLIDNRFNACKSCIKVLDYAAVGLPTLASNVPAYSDSLRDGSDCLLVDNDTQAWSSAVLRICKDRASLASLREPAARLVAPSVFLEGVDARLKRVMDVADSRLGAGART